MLALARWCWASELDPVKFHPVSFVFWVLNESVSFGGETGVTAGFPERSLRFGSERKYAEICKRACLMNGTSADLQLNWEMK